jgi:hypothetical protein
MFSSAKKVCLEPVMAALLWLPTFLIDTQVELYVKERFQYDNLLRLLYDQAFMFIVLAYPVTVASIIFTASSVMIPFAWFWAGGLWTILFWSGLFFCSVLVAAVCLAGRDGIIFIFLESLPATVFASVLFGMAVGRQNRKPPINDSQIRASKAEKYPVR